MESGVFFTVPVKNTPDSIGYVELIYAESNKIPYGNVGNAAGSIPHVAVRNLVGFRVNQLNVANGVGGVLHRNREEHPRLHWIPRKSAQRSQWSRGCSSPEP